MAAPTGHAKLSPSSAHRWLTCPASVKEAAQTVSSDTKESKAGTATHEVMSLWLTNGNPPEVGTSTSNGLKVTQEMIDIAGAAVGWVRQYVEGKQHTLFSEERIQIGAGFFGLDPEACWGTADILILAGDELVIGDLKAGYVAVQAEENPQLMLYAIGACEELGWMFDRIRLVIIQPANGGVKEWVLTKDELLARAEVMKPKVAEALSEAPAYHPSEEGCRYCPAAGVCKELQKEALALARQEFDTVDALVAHITPQELAEILTKADLIEAALKAAREHALRLLQVGAEVPGWKVVEARTNRKWKEGVEEKVMAGLRAKGLNEEEFAPRKLVSFTVVEKLAGKEWVEQYVEKPKGAATLAPVTDKRPALPVMTAIDTGNLLD